LDRFARTVLGYHGCNTLESVDFARRLLDGSVQIAQWQPSTNDYDWLGQGVYFWEYAPDRAREWAGPNGAVVGCVIQLGRCFDLTNSAYTQLLRASYEYVARVYKARGLELPKNEGRDLKLRKLDCLVINSFMVAMDNEAAGGGQDVFRYQTIRCPFEEGDEVYPGSMLKTQTHIQIAVRDPSCILGVFRPNI